MITRSEKKLTLKDVANVLSVTPATVSKALRDSSDISLDMREKVKAKAKAKELGYRPNLLARSLINNRSHYCPEYGNKRVHNKLIYNEL